MEGYLVGKQLGIEDGILLGSNDGVHVGLLDVGQKDGLLLGNEVGVTGAGDGPCEEK
jgi:hypothetical protein